MLRQVVLVIVLTASLVGALVWVTAGDAGMVVLQWGRFAYQSSLPAFVTLLVLAYLLVRLLLLAARELWRFRFLRRLRGWFAARRARRQTARGFLDLAGGEWARATRQLEGVANDATLPLANYLEAARAADQDGDFARRDALLDRAIAVLPEKRRAMGLSRGDVRKARLAIGIARAEMQRAQGDWDGCARTVAGLMDEAPRHPHVLRLKAAVHEARQEWDALADMQKTLRRQRVLDPQALTELEARIWVNRVRGLPATSTGDGLLAAWKKLPRRKRQDEFFVAGFAGALLDAGEDELAAETLATQLTQAWSSRLIELYGRAAPPDLDAHYARANAWRAHHAADPALHTALGRIALRRGDLPAAREHFEIALQLREDPEVQGELARVYISMGDTDKGLRLVERAFDALDRHLVSLDRWAARAEVLQPLDQSPA